MLPVCGIAEVFTHRNPLSMSGKPPFCKRSRGRFS
jgi:hypothetical protein